MESNIQDTRALDNDKRRIRKPFYVPVLIVVKNSNNHFPKKIPAATRLVGPEGVVISAPYHVHLEKGQKVILQFFPPSDSSDEDTSPGLFFDKEGHVVVCESGEIEVDFI